MAKFIDVSSFLSAASIGFETLLSHPFLNKIFKRINGSEDVLYRRNFQTGEIFVHPLVYIIIRLSLDDEFHYEASTVLLDCLLGKYDNLATFTSKNDFDV